MPTVTGLKPFHETAVSALDGVLTKEFGLYILGVIDVTAIPKGHDNIVAAIDRLSRFSMDRRQREVVREVREGILAQKQATSQKSEKKGVNLYELQQETERLLALLEDRQSGLISWNEFMQERLTNLHKLTSQALGK